MELNRYGNMLQHNQWFLFFIQIHSYIASKIHLSHRISWILILPTIIKAELVKIPFPFHCTSIIVALESRIVSNVRIMPNGFFQKKKERDLVRKLVEERRWKAPRNLFWFDIYPVLRPSTLGLFLKNEPQVLSRMGQEGSKLESFAESFFLLNIYSSFFLHLYILNYFELLIFGWYRYNDNLSVSVSSSLIPTSEAQISATGS